MPPTIVECPLLCLIAMLGWALRALRVHDGYSILIFKIDMHRLFKGSFTVDDGKRRDQEHDDWIGSLFLKDRLDLPLSKHE